ALPARPPCPMFAGPVPPATAALGAAALGTLRAEGRGGLQEPLAVETTLLPQVDTLGELGERPPRPPVEITPFELPERVTPMNLFRRRRPLAAAILVLAAAVSAGAITLTAREANAGPGTTPAPSPAPSHCARPGAPSGEGHC
ncbi:molecular chaperone DnaK, partial [Amycolatopsis sp. SID8362]|nr:molecular chaperone DnaK [Amycolatopsis sp. SID8362]